MYRQARESAYILQASAIADNLTASGRYQDPAVKALAGNFSENVDLAVADRDPFKNASRHAMSSFCGQAYQASFALSAISLGVGLLSFVLIYAGALGYKSFGHPEDHGHEDEPTFTPVEPAAAGSGGASAEAEVSHQQWAGDVLYYKEHILRHDADAGGDSSSTPLLAGAPESHDILDFSERRHLRRVVKQAMASNSGTDRLLPPPPGQAPSDTVAEGGVGRGGPIVGGIAVQPPGYT